MVSKIKPEKCPACSSADIYQDEDVLDTWFSSGLWPFSTLGWPLETADMKYFYPTTVMETGYDILFFWVARMIMMGLEFTGDIPFEIVYLHGLFRDELGRKMSKTIGNMIDPLTVMDQFGTDALRFTLLVGSTPGNDMNLSLKRVEANRNYINKIWNAGRFTISAIAQSPQKPLQEPQWTLADSWIWARTQALIRDVNRLFESFQFGEAGRQIYEFFWSEFADWYIEVAKLQIAEGGDRAFYTTQTLVQVLDLCLRMLHPFTPFVTEELWGHLKMATITCNFLGWNHMKLPDALIIASWPDAKSPESWENIKIEGFNLIQEIVRSIRNLRSEKGIPLGKHIPALFITSTHQKLIEDQLCVIAKLSQLDLDRTEIRQSAPVQIENYITLVESSVEIYLPLAGMIDQLEEIKRLGKELEDTRKQIQRLEELLASPFSIRAPDDIVNKEQIKLTKLLDMANKLESQLNALKQ